MWKTPPVTRSKTSELSESTRKIVLSGGLFSKREIPRTPVTAQRFLNFSSMSGEEDRQPDQLINEEQNQEPVNPLLNQEQNPEQLANPPQNQNQNIEQINQEQNPEQLANPPQNQNQNQEQINQDQIQNQEQANQNQNQNQNLGLQVPVAFRVQHGPMMQPQIGQYAVKLRDVINLVPIFTGDTRTGASYSDFAAGCQDARSLLPPQAEDGLVQMIRAKLQGGARQMIRGLQIVTVNELLSSLKSIYAPRESSTTLRGDIGRLCQGYDERVADYLTRAKELGQRLMELGRGDYAPDVDQDQRGLLDNIRRQEINLEVAEAFALGLKREIYSLMPPIVDLTDAGLQAIRIEGQIKAQEALRQPASNTMTCQMCERPGHKLANCPQFKQMTNRPQERPREEPGRSYDTCQVCKRRGHQAKQCRYYPRNQVNVVAPLCNLCEGTGHATGACPFTWRCPVCGIPAREHAGKICTPAAPRVRCQYCNGEAHTVNNCPRLQQKGINLPRVSAPATDGRGIPCFYCKKPGHFIRECEERIANNMRRFGTPENPHRLPGAREATQPHAQMSAGNPPQPRSS